MAKAIIPGSFSFVIFLSVFVIISGCKPHTNDVPREGYIQVKGGKVWYRIFGEGKGTPVLLLHGGPGVPSYYLNPLKALGKDRPLIFFDQLGCGRSDRITDTALMTTDNFVEQLEVVKKTLKLNEFYLYGQSWGTMLGTDYYLKYPDGIKGMILSGPAISIRRWLSDADTLIATLPDSIQQAIRINEANKTYDNAAYQRAVTFYYQHFLGRKLPWSADIDSAMQQTGANVYRYMGGPSEFTMPGPLKDYDRTGRLHEIKVPVLFITGEFDEARPSTVRYYQSLVPGAQMVIIKGAGHFTMQDNPAEDIRAISDFLNVVESQR